MKSTKPASRMHEVITVLVAITTFAAVADVASANDLGQDAGDEAATPVGCAGSQDPLLGSQDEICLSGASGCSRGSGAPAYEKAENRLGAGCDGQADCQGSRWATRTWQIEGEYRSGSGTVRFWVQCGADQNDESVDHKIVCETIETFYCEDGPEEDEGAFGCFHEVLKGDPEEIIGKCIDPLNPDIVYRSIPVGSAEYYDVFEHAESLR